MFGSFKSDAFAVGVTMLEAMSLIGGEHFYDFRRIEVDEERIRMMVEKQLDE